MCSLLAGTEGLTGLSLLGLGTGLGGCGEAQGRPPAPHLLHTGGAGL